MAQAERRTMKREKRKARAAQGTKSAQATKTAMTTMTAQSTRLAKPSEQDDSTMQNPSISKVEPPSNANSQNISNICEDFTSQQSSFREANSCIQTKPPMKAKQSRYIKAEVKDEVRLRDSDRCTFADPLTGKLCEARENLQFDHVQPYCQGGENTADNLRLRCFAHNKLHAIEKLGRKHMNIFYGMR